MSGSFSILKFRHDEKKNGCIMDCWDHNIIIYHDQMMYDLLIFVLFLASLGRLDPYNAAEGENKTEAMRG